MPDRLKIGGAGGREKKGQTHEKCNWYTYRIYTNTKYVISSNELCDLKNSHLLIESLKEF